MGNKIYNSGTAIAHEIEHAEEPVHPKNSACSVKVDVATPNKHDNKSEANLQSNRNIALTRKRMGHIDAAVNHMGHFVAAARAVPGCVFQLVMGKVYAIGSRREDEGVQSTKMIPVKRARA